MQRGWPPGNLALTVTKKVISRLLALDGNKLKPLAKRIAEIRWQCMHISKQDVVWQGIIVDVRQYLELPIHIGRALDIQNRMRWHCIVTKN